METSRLRGGVNWADGDTSTKTISITINADLVTEGDEWLSAALVRPEGGVVLGSQSWAKVRIVDANTPVAGVLQMGSMNYFVKENAGLATVTVRRSGSRSGAVSVHYSTSATAPGGIMGGPIGSVAAYPAATSSDFTAVSGTLTWADGDMTEKTVTIPIADDALVEGVEGFMFNLTSPTGGVAVGSPASAPVYILDDESSVVDVRNNQNGTDWRVWFPSDTSTLKGIFAYLPGSGDDTRSFVGNQSWQAMIQTWGFCLLGQHGNGFGAYSVADILDRAVLTAAFTGHPELANAPFVLTGFSYGSYESANAAEQLPERTLCFVGFNYGKTALSGLSTLQKTVPGVFLPGSEDSITPYLIKGFYSSYRSQGALTAVAQDWKAQHVQTDLGTGPLFTWHYVSEIIRLRYPAGAAPGVNPGDTVRLNTILETNGWLGDPLEADALSGRITYASPFVYINDYANYVSPRGFTKSTACWLPSQASAMSFRAQVSAITTAYSPLTVEPYQTPLKFTAPAEFQRFIVGDAVTVTVDPRNFSTYYGTISKMELYDQGIKIGERSSAPWTWTITSPAQGAHGLTVTALTTTGTQVAGLTLYTVGNAVLPTPPAFLSAVPNSATNIELYWTDTSYCEDGFRVERKIGASGTYALLATLAANTTAYTDAGLSSGIQYYYRVTAYNKTGDSSSVLANANTATAMSGPVASWSLDENGGTVAYDSSGNSNTGTLKNSPTFDPDAKPPGGWSLFFNGTGSYVGCGNGASLAITDAISIMGWFNHSPTGGDSTAGLSKPGSYRLTAQENNAASSKWQFYFEDSTGAYHTATTPNTFANGAWHHVCGTFNGNVLKIYVDGALQISQNWAGQIRANTAAFEIGRRDSSKYFCGKIDNVKIYNRAISADEVAAEYSAGLSMTFDSWRSGKFTYADRNNPSIAGAEADPDGDGVANLLEYAFARDPLARENEAAINYSYIRNPADNLDYLHISYIRRKSAAGVEYTNEASADLVNWSSDAASWQLISALDNGDNATETMLWRVKPGISAADRRFVRVRITKP